ncbi:hypothetical protein I317_01030 [Kwoniella heveanensis CBS 569]|nr:hypothetical protein I317_01030 [Kwoniella heveanensis CBS 569]
MSSTGGASNTGADTETGTGAGINVDRNYIEELTLRTKDSQENLDEQSIADSVRRGYRTSSAMATADQGSATSGQASRSTSNAASSAAPKSEFHSKYWKPPVSRP